MSEEKWNSIEILGELRAKYSCLDEKEQPYYHALSLGIEGIKALEQEPCEDCISRADVLAEIISFSTEEGASVECSQLYCDINNMPSVTPTRKKGKWSTQKGSLEIVCSDCGKGYYYHPQNNYFDFCPFCGADMRGGEE